MAAGEDAAAGPSENVNPTVQKFEAAINELSFDVDRWLLLVGNPRSGEGRELLAATEHWAMLCACDHDGVVSCYRALKGLSEVHRPRLSLAVLESLGIADAGQIHQGSAIGLPRNFWEWN